MRRCIMQYSCTHIFSQLTRVTFCSLFTRVRPLTCVLLPRTVAVIMREVGSWPRQPRPEITQTGGRGPAPRGQWWDGITRLNNALCRIMGPETETLNGITANHTTVKLLGFLHFQILAVHPLRSALLLGILLHSKIQIGVDTPSSWNATNASPWISN